MNADTMIRKDIDCTPAEYERLLSLEALFEELGWIAQHELAIHAARNWVRMAGKDWSDLTNEQKENNVTMAKNSRHVQFAYLRVFI